MGVGDDVGEAVGVVVGASDGKDVRPGVGTGLGNPVGVAVGAGLGAADGRSVGTGVGAGIGTNGVKQQTSKPPRETSELAALNVMLELLVIGVPSGPVVPQNLVPSTVRSS